MNNSSPLISIITVTYNAANIIQRTLDSVKEQSFTDFEYVVIDGNSSDATVELVKEADIPHTHIISEPDKGLYDAMNKGIKTATGKYLLFLNAGDTFHSSDTLALYAQKALEDKDIIYGDTIIVNQEGEFIAPRHLSVPDKLTKKSFSKGMLICHQAFMVKKSLAPLYNLNYRFSADYDWCVKCINNSLAQNCQNLREVTIDYLADGLTDKNKWKSLRERFRIMASHYGFVSTSLNHLSFFLRAFKRGKI